MPHHAAREGVPRRSWAARFQRRQRLKGSLWVIPLVFAIVGPVLAEITLALDNHVELPAEWQYTESTASTVLSAIVGAMVGLTGFVVAFGVLIIQMATQTLSPRFMRLWYRDGLQKAVLGIFVGTLTFSLALLREVSPHSVPEIGVSVAGIAVTVSVMLFLVYLDRFLHRLRPIAVGWIVADAGAQVFTAGLPAIPGLAPEPAAVSRREARARGPQWWRRARSRRSTRMACWSSRCSTTACSCSRTPSATSSRTTASSLCVFGAAEPPDSERLRGMIAIGEERTIEQDPAFALRILVDIAIRALSPSVNDPNDGLPAVGPDRGPAAGHRRERPARPRRAARRRRAVARARRDAALGGPARARAHGDP